nr:hypothetical protein [Tanacetum cinerariifolium]
MLTECGHGVRGDANPIRTLGDYSKPSHEGYKNTIELPEGNNVVPLQFDIIRMIHLHLGGSYYSFPCSILSTGKDPKTSQRYPDVPTISRRISFRSMDSFQGLTPKSPSSWHRPLAPSLNLLSPEDLALYDNESWNDLRDFAKLVKAISTPQKTSKTPDRRLFDLEDQINFLLKGSCPTPRPSSAHTPQAYTNVVYSNPHPRNQSEPPKQNSFTFHEHTSPWALETMIKARVRDYMAAHTERMERFKNAIFKQQEKINDRMKEMFELLKELTTSWAPKKC